MKKKQIVALLATVALHVVSLSDSSNKAYCADPQFDTEYESKQQQLEAAKLEFMNEAKEEAELAYKEIVMQEVAAQIAVKQVNEAKDLSIMSANMKKIAEENEVDSQETDDDLASVETYKSLEELLRVLEELQASAEMLDVKEPEQGALVDGVRTDNGYVGQKIQIEGENRENLERLVMGEAGGEGFTGAALVAQTIRDTMVKDGITDVIQIKKTHSYTASLDKAPNADVKRAVTYIFDEGGVAVKHRLIYYYAPRIVDSAFHESQKFVVEYGGHRFFDDWGE